MTARAGFGRLGTISQMGMRVTLFIQLALGIGLWTGRLDSVKGLHILDGILFVLFLWLVVIAAGRAGLTILEVAATAIWGLITLVFGLTHENILPDNLHWIIQIAHLAVGLGAMAQAERLGAAARSKDRAREALPREAVSQETDQ